MTNISNICSLTHPLPLTVHNLSLGPIAEMSHLSWKSSQACSQVGMSKHLGLILDRSPDGDGAVHGACDLGESVLEACPVGGAIQGAGQVCGAVQDTGQVSGA